MANILNLGPIHQICINKLKPRQLVPYFIQNKIPFDTVFHYDLSSYYVNFRYDSSYMGKNNMLYIDDFKEIFDVFSSIIVTGIMIKKIPSCSVLDEVINVLKIKCEKLRSIHVEGESGGGGGGGSGSDDVLDVSILGKCINLVKFSAKQCRVSSVRELEKCVKLRKLMVRNCVLDEAIDLSCFSGMLRIFWTDSTPACDLSGVVCGLRELWINNAGGREYGCVQKMYSLRKLCDLNVDDVCMWSNLKSVRNVSLRGSGLARVLGLDGIKVLRISDCSDLEEVQFCGLTKVWVNNCSKFVGVSWCEKLCEVDFMGCGGLYSLEFLRGCRRLVSVKVYYCENVCIDFSVFEECRYLSTFHAVGCKVINFRDVGKRHVCLRELVLDKVNSEGNLDVEELYGCSGLETVYLDCGNVIGVEKLGCGRFLELIGVGLVNSGGNLDWLSGCEALVSVYFCDASFTNVDQLKLCKKLYMVNFTRCNNLREINGLDCVHLSVDKCEKLRSLGGVGSEKLRNIILHDSCSFLGFDREYPLVKNISVVGGEMSHVQEIGMCKNLESVMFYNSKIIIVSGIEHCVKLRDFTMIFCNYILNVKPLAKCSSLKWLCIDSCGLLQNADNLLVGRDGSVMNCNRFWRDRKLKSAFANFMWNGRFMKFILNAHSRRIEEEE